jgi:thioredoxin 1
MVIRKQFASFEEYQKLLSIQDQPVVVDFFASWCGPCRKLDGYLFSLQQEFPHLIIVKIDIEQNLEIARKEDVKAVPTLMFVRNGNVMKRVVGLPLFTELREWVLKYAA